MAIDSNNYLIKTMKKIEALKQAGSFIDYYHVVFAHAQKASACSFAYTGKVENVELWDCYSVSTRNGHKLIELFGAETNLIVVYDPRHFSHCVSRYFIREMKRQSQRH